MKRFLTFICISTVLSSCLKEESVDLAKPATFTRYYSDGYDNTAVAVEQTKDGGFIILANNVYRDVSTDPEDNHIVIIRTNAYGDLLWRKYYPDVFPSNNVYGYKANSLTFLPDSSGYLIVGQNIEDKVTGESGLNSELLVFTISDTDGSIIAPTGSQPKIFTTTSTTKNWRGVAGYAKSDQNFIILADDQENKQIILGELNSTLDSLWTRTYSPESSSQGTITLANKLFYKSGTTPQVFWGSSGIKASGTSDLLFTRSLLNNPSTETGLLPIGTSTLDEFILDFCKSGGNYAYTGYSSENGGNIIFYKVNEDGNLLNSATYDEAIFNGKLPDGGNSQLEKGNSIVATRDNGFIILGTIETYAGGILGRGDTDMILFKINGFGDKQWSITYGSKDTDEGNCIRQTSDGGYIVLGTTTLGDLETIALIKVDSKGNINPE